MRTNLADPTECVVERLDAGDADLATPVLCEAFADYPVLRFVLGDAPDYEARLRRLVRFFVFARMEREEPLLGVRCPAGLAAAALVTCPRDRPSPDSLAAIREETWAGLGEEARARYEAFGARTAGFEIDAPHLHLNMIGVRREAQGRGLGRALLEAVHRLSSEHPTSTGVSLTTEVPSNVCLYKHFGYEITGRAKVCGAFTTWGMFRRDE